MKRVLLLLLAGVLSVGLAACGGGFAGYDLETTAQALLDSGAFEDALDTLDEESACMSTAWTRSRWRTVWSTPPLPPGRRRSRCSA